MLQFWLTIILLILLGLLGAYPALIRAQPSAKQALDALTPIQGMVGLVGLVWGVILLIQALFGIGTIGGSPVWWLTITASGAAMTVLGFLLSFGLLQQIGIMGGKAGQTGERIRAAATGYQIPLGIIALGLAVWYLLIRYVI